ncbi:DUF4254 domain-containing protein [Nocardia cyriacigeorgica]|uniref:DUF4254 domain-containing protein n=1 Tax=Nocardia cyriacigeorgica TaxID=135487 RepID=UPI0002D65320|nr:DUF4254 domain-containing protein [Nocardia cyriacigeorgica]
MAVIPSKELVLAACRGLPHADHPMLDAAGELTQLHEQRERTPVSALAKLDRRRGQLVRAIDRWVTLATPIPHGSARLHSETVGSIVDRMAQLTVQAFVASAHAPDTVYYDAWVRLHEVADSYQDLIVEVLDGNRRLPDAAGEW